MHSDSKTTLNIYAPKGAFFMNKIVVIIFSKFINIFEIKGKINFSTVSNLSCIFINQV
jgi:hypothetical protein